MNPITEILEQAKPLAIQYYALTGKHLGITPEYGEHCAARLMDLELVDVRTPGYDAIDPKTGKRVQIKTCVLQDLKQLSRRTGSIKLTYEWDTLALLILDANLEPYAIYEAPRERIAEALSKTDSKARARGTLSISQVKALSNRVWPVEAKTAG